MTWYLDSSGQDNRQDGAAQSFELSGETSYTLQVPHTFARGGCYWEVRASTAPGAGDGGSSQRIATKGCLW
ncbi:hypothetical protein [Streptomyces sparsus]